MRKTKSGSRGITLVEVMTVVVIIGILSTIGTVGYRRWVRSSKIAEATNVINGIAQAQEAYKAEVGNYVNVSGSLDNLYPARNPGAFKTAWGGPCDSCSLPWSTLAFQPNAGGAP